MINSAIKITHLLKGIEYNKMAEEQNRITAEIIQKCVAKEFSTEEKNVQILDLEVSPGAAHGDNFATVVKLAKFKYKIN